MNDRASIEQEIARHIADLVGVGGDEAYNLKSALEALRNAPSINTAQLQAAAQPLLLQAAQVQTASTKSSNAVNIAAVLTEIAAREAELAAEANDFRDYESHSFMTIQARAAAMGIDISTLEAERERLVRERDATIASGDVLGSYRTDVGMARNNLDGLGAVGADDAEKQKAQQHYEEARARYEEQAKLEAQRKAAEMELSGQQSDACVAATVGRAMEALEEEQAQAQQREGAQNGQLENRALIHTAMAQIQSTITEAQREAEVATGSFAPHVAELPSSGGFDFD